MGLDSFGADGAERLLRAGQGVAASSLAGWRKLLGNLSDLKLALVLAVFFGGVGAGAERLISTAVDQEEEVTEAVEIATAAAESTRVYRERVRVRLADHQLEYLDLQRKIDAVLRLMAHEACTQAGNPPEACNEEAIRRIIEDYGGSP